MAPPAELVQWLARTYPKPQIDAEWLDACYDWVSTEFDLNPATDMPKIKEHVEAQLLQSDLADSMDAGTGLPVNVSEMNAPLRGPPILVEIIAMTDIGQSAFNLQNVRQTRIDRADLAGLAEDDGGEDDGPVPRYPRSMLRFELSDGSTTLNAFEYRRLPELELGETLLGYKMQLKNVPIKRGFAFLEPSNVVMKGHQTEDRDANRDADFVRGLQIRLNPDAEPPPVNPAPQNNRGTVRAPTPVAQAPVQMPVRAPARAPPTPQRTGPVRTAAAAPAPLSRGQKRVRTRSPSPIAGPSQPRGNTTQHPRMQSAYSEPPPSSATLVNRTISSYFTKPDLPSPLSTMAKARVFSPTRRAAPLQADEDEDDLYLDPPKAIDASSDYGFEDDVPMDPALWEEVDRVATRVLGAIGAQKQVPRVIADEVIDIDDDEDENIPVRPRQPVRTQVDDDDVIDISD